MITMIKNLLSDKDNVSSTRIMFIIINFFVIIASSLLLFYDKMTDTNSIFLLSFAGLAWSGKAVSKFKEEGGNLSE